MHALQTYMQAPSGFSGSLAGPVRRSDSETFLANAPFWCVPAILQYGVYLEVGKPQARDQLCMDSQHYEGALSEQWPVLHYAQKLEQLPHR